MYTYSDVHISVENKLTKKMRWHQLIYQGGYDFPTVNRNWAPDDMFGDLGYIKICEQIPFIFREIKCYIPIKYHPSCARSEETRKG